MIMVTILGSVQACTLYYLIIATMPSIATDQMPLARSLSSTKHGAV